MDHARSGLLSLRNRELGGKRLGSVYRPLRTKLQELRSSDELTYTCVVDYRYYPYYAVPPFAASFSRRALGGQLLAVADEEGCVRMLDTRKPFGNVDALSMQTDRPDPWVSQAGHPKSEHTCTYEVHRNAIFDVQWLRDDHCFATVSGDTTAKVTSVRDGESLATLKGHTGSIKTVRQAPGSDSVLATAGRDGMIMMWDLRSAERRVCKPMLRVSDAHAPRELSVPPSKRSRKGATNFTPRSVTALTFLNERSLVTAGAADGCVKIWDTRHMTEDPVQCLSLDGGGSGPAMGLSAIDVDESGGRLLVATTDSRINVYRMAWPELEPERVLVGHSSRSFYVKAKFGAGGDMVISGSEDSRAYIWDLGEPLDPELPVQMHCLSLEGHRYGEVSDVAWCQSDEFCVATVGDDTTVKVWKPPVDGSARGNERGRAVVRDRVVRPGFLPEEQRGLLEGTQAAPSRRQTSITSFFSSTRNVGPRARPPECPS